MTPCSNWNRNRRNKGNVTVKPDDKLMPTYPQGSTPVPDPTILTTQQLVREIAASREILEAKYDTRLAAMDTATELNKLATDGIPRMVADRVAALEKVINEKFAGIQTQFKERDIRAEREARDNKVAVDAAFAAQKEAAAKQDEANAKAIDKSERATTETIKTNQELSLSKIDALTSQVSDLKLSVVALNTNEQGHIETKSQNNFVVGLIITVVLALLGNAITLMYLFTHK